MGSIQPYCGESPERKGTSQFTWLAGAIGAALLKYAKSSDEERYGIIINGIVINPDDDPYTFKFKFGNISQLSNVAGKRVLGQMAELVAKVQNIKVDVDKDYNITVHDNALLQEIEDIVGSWS